MSASGRPFPPSADSSQSPFRKLRVRADGLEVQALRASKKRQKILERPRTSDEAVFVEMAPSCGSGIQDDSGESEV